jgi:hypothetical protein
MHGQRCSAGTKDESIIARAGSDAVGCAGDRDNVVAVAEGGAVVVAGDP